MDNHDGQDQELQSAVMGGIQMPPITGPFQPSQMRITNTSFTRSQLPSPLMQPQQQLSNVYMQPTVKGGIQMPYTPEPFHPSPPVLPQLSYQQIRPQLAQQLKMFWYNQYNETLGISSATVFKDHKLPLARIKKIMMSSEDPTTKMAQEAPVLFGRACETFILELTYRAWAESVENKRRMLSKKDIARAITKSEVFDFLVDIVPREKSGKQPKLI